MTETVKVSIQLKLEIPVKYDELGHRLSPTQLAAPYVERLYADMRAQGLPFGDYEYEDMVDQEEYEKLAAQHGISGDEQKKAQLMKDLNEKARADTDKLLHDMWRDGQDRLTKETYGISWGEYTSMSDEQRAALPLLTDGVGTATAARLQERKPPHEVARGN